jgi:hypothetical protein
MNSRKGNLGSEMGMLGEDNIECIASRRDGDTRKIKGGVGRSAEVELAEWIEDGNGEGGYL